MKKKKKLKHELKISIQKKDVKKATDEKITKLTKTIDLKGFRKGFVPKTIIKTRFGSNIYQNILNDLFSKKLANYIKDKKLNIVNNPKLKSIPEEIDECIIFTLEFELFPEINIKLTNIKIDKYISKINKNNINDEITRLRSIFGKQEIINSYAKNNDEVKIDLYTLENKKIDFIFKNKKIILDKNEDNIKNLKNYLINKEFNKKYPIDLENNEVKESFITNCKYIHIKEIKRKIPMDINEDFFIKIGLKEKNIDLNLFIKKKLINISNNLSKKIMNKDILKNLIDKHIFEIPQTLLNNKKNNDSKISQIQIINDIKLQLILNEIKKKFNINISNKEVNEYIDKISTDNNNNNKKDKEKFIKEIENYLYIEKILKIIKTKITILDKSIEFDDLIKMDDLK